MAKHKQFVVCIRNDEYEASLELRKIYEVLEDSNATKHQMLRVIDEEGEAYLYPASWFVPIKLPKRRRGNTGIGRALMLQPNSTEQLTRPASGPALPRLVHRR